MRRAFRYNQWSAISDIFRHEAIKGTYYVIHVVALSDCFNPQVPGHYLVLGWIINCLDECDAVFILLIVYWNYIKVGSKCLLLYTSTVFKLFIHLLMYCTITLHAS
jgi:hypothetical protein